MRDLRKTYWRERVPISVKLTGASEYKSANKLVAAINTYFVRLISTWVTKFALSFEKSSEMPAWWA
jgi:hypothetical protein